MTLRTNQRLRHENAGRRTLTVTSKQQLSDALLAITFACDDWAGFTSAAPDDHIKIFIPGAPFENGKPAMRDYTPRRFDPKTGEFVIEFALHEGPGPVTAWAVAAQIGDTLEIGGPRGSVVIPDDYDWYWLIGDEAALPAIARRLEEWAAKPVTSFAAVTGPGDELALARPVNWVHRAAQDAADPAALIDRLGRTAFPAGDGFVWIAAEAGVTRAIREHILSRGHSQTQMKASGYWTLGHADTTAKFD